METNFQKIQTLIVHADLPKEEQDNFIVLLAFASDKDLESLVRLFSQDKNWISKIYRNIKSKQEALLDQSSQSWQKIVQEEEILLQNQEK